MLPIAQMGEPEESGERTSYRNVIFTGPWRESRANSIHFLGYLKRVLQSWKESLVCLHMQETLLL